VVVVARRKGDLEELGSRGLARRPSLVERAREQVLRAARARRRDRGRAADRAFVLEEPFEHADRRVVRGARALRRFAVPSAVLELLGEEALQQALRRPPEVAADRERAAVDARLDLALEERLRAELLRPAEAVVQSPDRRRDGGIVGRRADLTEE